MAGMNNGERRFQSCRVRFGETLSETSAKCAVTSKRGALLRVFMGISRGALPRAPASSMLLQRSLSGFLGYLIVSSPKVVAALQPWAGGRNPVGIPGGSPVLKKSAPRDFRLLKAECNSALLHCLTYWSRRG